MIDDRHTHDGSKSQFHFTSFIQSIKTLSSTSVYLLLLHILCLSCLTNPWYTLSIILQHSSTYTLCFAAAAVKLGCFILSSLIFQSFTQYYRQVFSFNGRDCELIAFAAGKAQATGSDTINLVYDANFSIPPFSLNYSQLLPQYFTCPCSVYILLISCVLLLSFSITLHLSWQSHNSHSNAASDSFLWYYLPANWQRLRIKTSPLLTV